MIFFLIAECKATLFLEQELLEILLLQKKRLQNITEMLLLEDSSCLFAVGRLRHEVMLVSQVKMAKISSRWRF